MTRPLLLDLFCGAGGAAMGYHRAGFDVVGVDIKPQPRYPFRFIQANALDWLSDGLDAHIYGRRLDAIHASPPCQAYSGTRYLWDKEHPALIEPTRSLLVATGLPYVIENVAGSPLQGWVQLCGSNFGLAVKRHRWFESSVPLMAMPCTHPTAAIYPTHAKKTKAQLSPFVHIYGTGGGAGKDINLWRRAMDVPWMETKAEIAEAIPPAYTEFIGERLLEVIEKSEPDRLPG